MEQEPSGQNWVMDQNQWEVLHLQEPAGFTQAVLMVLMVLVVLVDPLVLMVPVHIVSVNVGLDFPSVCLWFLFTGSSGSVWVGFVLK